MPTISLKRRHSRRREQVQLGGNEPGVWQLVEDAYRRLASICS
jgi:hypothetical protein